MNYLQQGDVLMKRIDKVPDGERTHDKQTRSKILAYGEVTGHCHAIDDEADAAQVFRVNTELFMIIAKAVSLKHEEHNRITVPPGTYKIDIVREADHLSGVVRRVAD